MEELFFWKRWGKPYNTVYFIFFCLFLGVFANLIVEYNQGEENLVHWAEKGEVQSVTLAVDEFQEHFIDFKREAEQYLVITRFIPVVEQSKSIDAYLFLVAIAVSAILLLMAITYIKKVLWYALSMTVFMGWVLNLRLDLHEVFGVGNQYFTVLVVLVFVFVTYYFFALKPESSLLLRLFTFVSLFVFFGGVIALFSPLNQPFVHLANYGAVVPVLLTLLFIFSISHEIVRALLYLVSSNVGTTTKMNFVNLLIFSFLYLGNLLLMYFNSTGKLNWELVYLNPFILVFISIAIGVWGFRKKSDVYASILPFHPAGAYFYLGLAVLSVSCLSYAFASYNSSLILVFEQAIIYGHLAFGVSFLAYVLFNFLPELQANIPFYKNLYNSKYIPYYTVSLTGIMILFVMLSKVNYQPYRVLQAAYFNCLGDVYTIDGNRILAKNYYSRGRRTDIGNLKSSLCAAQLFYEDGEYDKVEEELSTAKIRLESPFIYAMLSDVMAKQAKPLADKLTLEQAVQTFPESGELWNNFGCAYFDTKGLDSSLFYFYKASNQLSNPDISNANTYAFVADRKQTDLAQQVVSSGASSNSLAYLANYTVLENMVGMNKSPLRADLLPDSILTSESLAYFNNYILGHTEDASSIVKEKIAQYRRSNNAVQNTLDFLSFNLAIEDGKLDSAKFLADQILKNTPQDFYPFYSNYLGVSFTKASRYAIADQYLQKSYNTQRLYGFNSGPLNFALNSVLLFSTDSYDQLKASLNIHAAKYLDKAGFYASIMGMTQEASIWQDLKDDNKLLLILFQLPYWNDDILFDVLASVKNENVRAKSIAIMLHYYLERNQLELAHKAWGLIPNQNLDSYTINSLNLLYLEKIFREGKYLELKERAVRLDVNDDQKEFKKFYEGVALAYLDDLDKAEPLLNLAMEEIQLNESVNWNVIEFYGFLKKDRELAFNMSVKALETFKYSIPLWRQYVFLSLYMNYDGFAEQGMEQLASLMTEEQYAQFETEYAQVEKMALEEFKNW